MEQKVILIDGQQHATVLAALRFYQQAGMGEPSNRSDAIHDIATNMDEVISLDEAGIDDLVELLQYTPPAAETLSVMKENGLTIGECISTFAVSNEDPYVKKARELIAGSDDVEIDDKTTTSIGEDGAFVLSWMWVSNEEAGVHPYAELLESVLDCARSELSKKDTANPPYAEFRVWADWLESLISNYADELDSIETEVPIGLPGTIAWVDETDNRYKFMPSTALGQLLLLARQGGLPTGKAQQAESFCIRYGNKLDAILTVVQTA